MRFLGYSEEGYINEGLEYTYANKYEEAIKSFLIAQSYDTNSGLASYHIGRVYFLKGEFTTAISYFQKSAQMTLSEPYRYRVIQIQGDAWRILKEYRIAIELYHRAIHEYVEPAPGNDATLWGRIATCYDRLGDLQASCRASENAISGGKGKDSHLEDISYNGDNNNCILYARLAVSQARLNEFVKAKKSVDIAHEKAKTLEEKAAAINSLGIYHNEYSEFLLEKNEKIAHKKLAFKYLSEAYEKVKHGTYLANIAKIRLGLLMLESETLPPAEQEKIIQFEIIYNANQAILLLPDNISAYETKEKATTYLHKLKEDELKKSQREESRLKQWQADDKRSNGDIEQAISDYELALAKDPENIYAHYGLACSFQLQSALTGDHYQKVIDSCDAVITLDKQHVEAQQLKGSILREMGRNQESISVYETLTQYGDYQQQSFNHAKLGKLFEEENNIEQAEANYHIALEKDPYNHIARHNLGNLIHKKDNKKALSCLETAYKQQPGIGRYRVDYAMALAESANGDTAILQQAAAILPNDQKLAIKLGNALVEQKKYADAENIFHQLLSDNPNNIEMLDKTLELRKQQNKSIKDLEALNLGMQALQTGDTNRAKEIFQADGIKENAIAQYQYALICLQTDEKEKAEEALEACIKQQPHQEKYLTTFCKLKLEARKPEAVITHLKSHVDATKAYTPLITDLGNAYLAQGDIREAQRYFTQALEKNNEDINANLGVAICLTRTGNIEKGKEKLKQITLAKSTTSISVKAYRELIRVFENQKMPEQALENAYKALQLTESLPEQEELKNSIKKIIASNQKIKTDSIKEIAAGYLTKENDALEKQIQSSLSMRTLLTAKDIQRYFECFKCFCDWKGGTLVAREKLADFIRKVITPYLYQENKYRNLLKHIGHLLSKKNDNIFDYEGWGTDTMLYSRIQVLFEMLLDLDDGIDGIISDTGKAALPKLVISQHVSSLTWPQIKQAIFSEIAIEMEALLVYQVSLLILTYSIRSKSANIEKLAAFQARNILDKAAQLSVGQEYTIASNKVGHAIFMTLYRVAENEFQLRVENRGEGCDKFHLIKNKKISENVITYVYPYIFRKLTY
ncbi:MAG: tetratricopeptide repeat protein, partial [Pseudomonadota bacterium]|nr:tetratricopeptide repeat protein [Pseudomonadota bacterium]